MTEHKTSIDRMGVVPAFRWLCSCGSKGPKWTPFQAAAQRGANYHVSIQKARLEREAVSSEGLTRVTVNLIPEAYAALLNSAQRDEDNRTTVINRALQLYNLIIEEMVRQGIQNINIGDKIWKPSDVFPKESE